ncbi:hypothetical protein N9A94_04280 [Akkermansiaceae bacterium]|nr:hypothetical protein [Akkermansiaceae bacterium]MDB4537158.1 hypothetical protein [Akkermansiaceae bacterium]
MNSLRHFHFIALGFAILLSQIPSASAEDKEYRTAAVKLTHQLSKDSAEYGDLCGTMAAIGIDYPVLLQGALDGKPAAIRLLIWAGENAGLDGAASEGYSYTMVKVAKKIGDAKLASAVEALDLQSFTNTQMFFRFEFGFFDGNEAAATKELQKSFPKFWQQITKRVEQAGAHRPATAEDSKSEGKEKPQLESEGRSR